MWHSGTPLLGTTSAIMQRVAAHVSLTPGEDAANDVLALSLDIHHHDLAAYFNYCLGYVLFLCGRPLLGMSGVIMMRSW